MEQELAKIEQTYDGIAEEYAQTFAGEHDKKPKDQEMLRRFAAEIGDRRPLWDLGCGPGQTARFLKDLGLAISGLDLSGELLNQARINHPDIPFQKGNILELVFENNSIAGIVAFYAIVHFTAAQVGMAFREVFRVLQPGGIVLFTYHIGDGTISIREFLDKKIDIDFMFFHADFIIRLLKEAGFEKIEITERAPYPGVEYQSRRAYVWARKPGPGAAD